MIKRWNKWFVLLFYIGFVLLVVLYRDELRVWIQEGIRPAVPLMLLIATLAALMPVPIIPYGVLGGLMAAKYGLALGTLLGWAGTTLAALIMFLLIRSLGTQKARELLSRYRNIDRFTQLVERRPFISFMLARMIPIVPAQAVNLYGAVSRVPFLTFATASALGKIPLMAIYAFAGYQLLGSTA